MATELPEKFDFNGAQQQAIMEVAARLFTELQLGLPDHGEEGIREDARAALLRATIFCHEAHLVFAGTENCMRNFGDEPEVTP
jgi:hypothetical protein